MKLTLRMANQVLLVRSHFSCALPHQFPTRCEAADLLAIGQRTQLHAEEIGDTLGDLARNLGLG